MVGRHCVCSGVVAVVMVSAPGGGGLWTDGQASEQLPLQPTGYSAIAIQLPIVLIVASCLL